MLAVDDTQPVAASVVEVGDARERFAQWREGKAGQVLAVSVIGDSYSAGQDFYLNKLVQRVAGEVGFAGPGYVGFNHGAALGGTHFKYTRSSEKYFGGDWKVSGLGQASPDSRTVTGRPGAWLQVDASPRRRSTPSSLKRNYFIWATVSPVRSAIAGRHRKTGNP